MSEEGPLSIGSITDLVRILQEHPEWREQLRTLLLSEDQQRFPQRFEQFIREEHEPLRQTVQELAQQVTRLTLQVERLTEQVQALTTQVQALTQRMERVEAQIETLTQRLNELTQRMERVEAQIETLTQRLNELTQRMERVEAQIETLTQRLNELTQRMERVEAQIETLTQRLNELTQRLNELTQRVDELTQRMERAERDLGELKGAMQELRAAQKAPAYFAQLGFYRIKALEPVELGERLEKALEENQITPEEYQELMQLDLVILARRPHEPDLYVFAVEVSWTVDSYDVERAARRAELLRKLYPEEKPTLRPVAWGTRFTAQAQDQAYDLGVELLQFERPR